MKDITGNMMRDMEEKPMCMMMKEPSDKDGKQIWSVDRIFKLLFGIGVWYHKVKDW